jgi:predicted ribosomally synthesized peptide with nif11-like leader
MDALTCEDAGLFASRALEDDLNAGETQQLAAHLADCNACRTRQAAMVVADGWVKELGQFYQTVALDKGFGLRLAAALPFALPPQEALRRFNQRVASDADLQEHVKQSVDMGNFVQLYVRLGNESGFRFSDVDVKQLMAAANDWELSDLELDAVVGGTASVEQFLNKLLGVAPS